jgi:hypothetical protein
MNGRDVTDLPDLWSKDDFEVLTTQFSDPEQTSGLHANSPLSYFERHINGKWKHIDKRNRTTAVLCILNHPLYFTDQKERESK